MAVSQAKKAKICLDLKAEKSVDQIAKVHEVSTATVYNIKRSFEAGKLDHLIEQAHEATPEVLAEIVEHLPENIQAEAKEISNGLYGLDKLKSKFQETGLKLANRIIKMSEAADLTPGEMLVLSKAFNETVQAFSTSATIINVMNGTDKGSDKLSFYKQSLRN